jgi:predicted ABC-type ATPase
VPILTLIAGPNGSGKSTLTEWVDLEGRGLLLDPDAIARTIHPAAPRLAAIAAGREMLQRIDGCFSRKVSFAVETTLSGRGSLQLIREARAEGYEIHLTFVALDSPERCIARIRTRALRGGHSVPDADVRRRYERSLSNLPAALYMVDIAKVYDNSGDKHRLVLTVQSGVVIYRMATLPNWVRYEG